MDTLGPEVNMNFIYPNNAHCLYTVLLVFYTVLYLCRPEQTNTACTLTELELKYPEHQQGLVSSFNVHCLPYEDTL